MVKDLRGITDEKLIELVRSQDQELYSEIVTRYQEKLLRYANYLIQERDKSQDVVQEAFIKAFINLQGFNTKKKFSSWIYRITHNEAINHIKKHQKEITLDVSNWLKDKKDKSNIEEDFQRKELQKVIASSLKEMPIIYREPLVLFFLEEKSYNEISDILRIPIGTLSTRINRAKKYLKKIYEAKQG